MKNLTIILITLIFISSCQKSIKGRFVDNNGNSLNDVMIKISNKKKVIYSDTNGYFMIKTNTGKQTILFTKSGYFPIIKEVDKSNIDTTFGLLKFDKIPIEKGIYFQNIKGGLVTLVLLEPKYNLGNFFLFDSIRTIQSEFKDSIRFYSNVNLSVDLFNIKDTIYDKFGKPHIGFKNGSFVTFIKGTKTLISDSIYEFKYKLEKKKIYIFEEGYEFSKSNKVESKDFPFIND